MNKYTLAFLATSTLISGCSGLSTDLGAYETGTEITDEQLASIPATSTQKQVSEQIGQPNRKEMLGEKELWYYDHTMIRHLGKPTNESVVFEFDKSGKLLESYRTGRTSKTGNPLLDAQS